MATRTIVTSQPDVACDVCERRLLRGEQPDVFLAAGRRRTVCELCAPRAVHEGWMREADRQSVSLPPLRPRRGRSLFDRLRHVGRPATATDQMAATGASAEGDQEGQGEQYDFLEGRGGEPAGPPPARTRGRSRTVAPEATLATGLPDDDTPFDAEQSRGVAESRKPRSEVERALDLFNASEYPRRMAGVARSLGAPEVNARSAEHARSVVRIVVAWELCWYRYEVDLDEPEVGARAAGQGTELEELTREDRRVNAVADDAGALSLSAP
jgi:hypothetical protein